MSEVKLSILHSRHRIFCTLTLIALLQACSTTRAPSVVYTEPTRSATQVEGLQDPAILAISLIGTPYRYGGGTPEGGFDCSGLVQYVYRQSSGIKLPRTTSEIATRGETIPADLLATGDLVFYNTDGNPFSHVGIYVGDGRFVHAPSSGGVVRLETMSKAYWQKRFTLAKRLDPIASVTRTY